MQNRAGQGEPESAEEQALALYLQSLAEQSRVDVQALCARFPELSSRLLRIHADCALAPASQPSETGLRSQLRSGDRVAGFQLVRPLGQGGMGVVWEATQVGIERRVALKILASASPTPRSVERFTREARATGALQHPSIATVYDAGCDGGWYWIAQELVGDGLTLADRLRETSAAPELPYGWDAWAAEVVARIGEALHVAHEQGIIHRDVKPANVLLRESGEPVLTDFGLARVLTEDAISATGDQVGTAPYMSPEQTTGREEVGPPSDVFSLGVLLYELLTLVRPFRAESPQALMAAIRESEPVGCQSLRDSIPTPLALITQRALRKLPEARYSSAHVLAADLRRFLRGERTLARRPSLPQRARSWASSNPWLTRTLLVVLLSLVAGLVQGYLLFRSNGALAASNSELSLRAKLGRALLLEEQASNLVPIRPELLPVYDQWLVEAYDLLAGRAHAQSELEDLRSQALPRTTLEALEDRESHPRWEEFNELGTKLLRLAEKMPGARLGIGLRDGESRREALNRLAQEIQQHEEERDALALELESRRTWSFQDPALEERESTIERLLLLLDGFEDVRSGLMVGTSPAHGPGIQRRREYALLLRDAALSPEQDALWREAALSVKPSITEEELEQLKRHHLDLIPLGVDPESGWHEFGHRLCGTPPVRTAEGSLLRSEDASPVLVLLPGGTYMIGAGRSNAARIDPRATDEERARDELDRVRLDPFLISKFELTQAQWVWLAGENPSWFLAGSEGWGGHALTGLAPVDNVGWDEATRALRRIGLELPTEAQWEYAARGDVEHPWWTGPELLDLNGRVNFADSFAFDCGSRWPYEPKLFDGANVQVDTGTFPPSPYGLHEVLGNVAEWVRDEYGSYRTWGARDGDGLRPPTEARLRVVRGGSYQDLPEHARVTARESVPRATSRRDIGLRPMRSWWPE